MWLSSKGRACPMGLQSMWTLGLAIWKLVLKTLCEGRFESKSVVLLIQLLLLKKKKKKEKQVRLKSNCLTSLQLNEFIEGSVKCYYTCFSCHKSHVNCLVKLFKNSHYLICSSYQSLKLIFTCLCLPRVLIYCFPDYTLCFAET